jgi:hypothetical protein
VSTSGKGTAPRASAASLSTTSGQLPATGRDVAPLADASLALVLAGAMLWISFGRKRKGRAA